MKYLDAVLVVLFAVFAVIQFNDPDPLVWAALYGLVAVVAGLAFFGRHVLPLTLAVTVACLAALAWSTPGFIEYLTTHRTESIIQDMAPDRPYIEQTREFGGALIALAGLLIYLWRGWRARRATADRRMGNGERRIVNSE